MNPYLQDILHNITTRLAKLEESQTKKEWVGLTDEELQEIYQGGGTVHFKLAMAEEKLKEKNT